MIAFGNPCVLPQGDEFYAAIGALANKYSPNVSAKLRENEMAKYTDKIIVCSRGWIIAYHGLKDLELC